MHRLLPIGRPPTRSWAPRLSPLWVLVTKPFRWLDLRFVEKVRHVEVIGSEHIRSALDQNAAVMIAPNHAAFCDPHVLMTAADRLRTLFYFMTAWQVFGTRSRFHQWALQRHGCFSVDREGTDLGAFKRAVGLLTTEKEPLVVFPEGDIYRTADRVTPFREGPAAIALAAAKRGSRRVVVTPAGIKYYFVSDPTANLQRTLSRLETQIGWSAKPDRPIVHRIYELAEELLAKKETEQFGAARTGPLQERIRALADAVLQPVEQRCGLRSAGPLPERIKAVRRSALKSLGSQPAVDSGPSPPNPELDAALLAEQLFCYPGDYVSEKPSVERAAETIDKLEEDLLGVTLPKPRAARRAVIAFGEPIAVEPGADRTAAASLTQTLERRVQTLLDGIPIPDRPWSMLPC